MMFDLVVLISQHSSLL